MPFSAFNSCRLDLVLVHDCCFQGPLLNSQRELCLLVVCEHHIHQRELSLPNDACQSKVTWDSPCCPRTFSHHPTTHGALDDRHSLIHVHIALLLVVTRFESISAFFKFLAAEQKLAIDIVETLNQCIVSLHVAWIAAFIQLVEKGQITLRLFVM